MSTGTTTRQAATPGFLAEAETSIPDRFAHIAALHPSRIALAGARWQATYAELEAVTDRFASTLISRGGSVGDRVALLMRQDAPLTAAALSVLKTGRILVVLNPTDPPARLKQILVDAEPDMIVTDLTNENLAGQIAERRHRVLRFEEQNSEPPDRVEIRVFPSSPACLIYTSGSTGRPKGVVLTHRNIIHNVMRHCQGMNVNAGDRIALLASPSGGQGVSTTWCSLLNGATLHTFPTLEKGVTGLNVWTASHNITVYVSSASIFRHFARTLSDADFFPDVRLVRFGADAATAHDYAIFRKHFPKECILLNSLSTSETGNITHQRFTHDSRIDGGRLPVGWPAEGMEVLLLDKRGVEVRNGEIGEITVRSHYLSPGYWRDEKLTAARFFEHGADGLREFRSGDLGRRTADGALVCIGRKDAQVKIRGYRIDVTEIETTLLQQPDIKAAAVSARKEASEDIQLVAFVAFHSKQRANAESLRASLGRELPRHMVPNRFILLNDLPLTPNGKIDREKLRQINPDSPARTETEDSMTATEKLLAGIWKTVLKRDSIGRDENFFALGGDSLNAGVVAAKIFAAIKVEIELRAFNDHPTLAGLSSAIDRLALDGRASNAPRLSRVSRDAPLPLSFRQEDIWKSCQNASGMHAYTMACSHLIRGPLDVDVLRESMSYIAGRHEILRTTFDEVNGRPAQIVHPPEPVALPVYDFAGLSDAEAKAREVYKEEAAQLLDLKRIPPIRFSLARIRENEHWLVRVSHHIITDAWSWKIYFRELGMIYEAKLRGEAPALPESEPLQYADYAAHQRGVLNSGTRAREETLEWWSRLHSEKPPPQKLPFKRLLGPRNASPDEGVIWWGLDPATTQRLENLGREAGATCYIIRLAALFALLADNARRHDVVLGTYVTGRNRVELHEMMGDFANQVMLRLRCDSRRTFREWLPTVREAVGEAQLRGEIPYERVREEISRRGGSPPEIRIIFTVSEHTASVRFGDLEVLWLRRQMEGMPWGFCITMDQHNEEQGCRVTFDARIYDPARVRKWVNRFAGLLNAASENPDLPLAKMLSMAK